MRQLGSLKKKVRGVPRRLRSVREWAETFKCGFPIVAPEAEAYWNVKIPVLSSLVESKQTTQSIRRQCAQALIDGCQNLIALKPPHLAFCRIVAAVCVPDLFTSEICIYLDEEYFQTHTAPFQNESSSKALISDRRLSEEWRLCLPQGFEEFGLSVTESHEDWSYRGEYWFFGEVKK